MNETIVSTVASRCSVALWTINQKCIDYNNSNSIQSYTFPIQKNVLQITQGPFIYALVGEEGVRKLQFWLFFSTKNMLTEGVWVSKNPEKCPYLIYERTHILKSTVMRKTAKEFNISGWLFFSLVAKSKVPIHTSYLPH